MNKINLKNFTFIIPVKIESEDRKNNAKIVLGLLHKILDTNIIIYEAGSNVVPSIFDIDNDGVEYIHQDLKEGDPFHRTKYLNIMLKKVKTRFTINYDLDVILELKTYKNLDLIMDQSKSDLLFPYGLGNFQKMVEQSSYKDLIKADKNFYEVLDSNSTISDTFAGHCQVFKTASYIQGGMEDENFISYGPEDRERKLRFSQLGYTTIYLQDHYVYHLEHSRSQDSGAANAFFEHNCNLYNRMVSMSVYDYMDYIESRSK
tara:strand:+ start:647 stop:1426 length:780 start_codon:yes stop_codon:yes gene_type:complete